MKTDPNPRIVFQDSEWQGDSRPSIPRAIVAEILIEAGHHCAVCGESTPLERAHIIPWRKVKEHKAENLVCLCANCHQRADSEKWGEKILKEYKHNPWVRRRYATEAPPKRSARVELTIAMDLRHFDEVQQRWLQHALASFLDIAPSAIIISSIEEGSVKVIVELPVRHANRLLKAYLKSDSKLQSKLVPLDLTGLKVLSDAAAKKAPAKKVPATKAKKAPAKKTAAKPAKKKALPAKKAMPTPTERKKISAKKALLSRILSRNKIA